jgi:hypothetical protein
MWNYSYTLAESTELAKINQQYETAVYIEDQDVLFALSKDSKQKNLTFPLESIPEEWSSIIGLSYKWAPFVQSLLQGDITITLEEWSKQYLITKWLEESITDWIYKKGYIFYQHQGHREKVQVQSTNPLHCAKTLVTIKALREGYDIKEVKGSHFEISSLTQPTEATSIHSCTCNSFSQNKVCTHIYIAHTITSNRRAYYAATNYS